MAIIYFSNYNFMNETDIQMDMIAPGMGMMAPEIGFDLGLIQAMGLGLTIFQIVTFILTAWGLYTITKKLGEKHSWLAFIPVLQLYNYFAISKKSVLTTLVYPIIALIIGGFLTMFTFGISLIIAGIYLLVMIIKLYHGISIRCGRGVWTTVGLIFLPFIMFPVVGVKLENKSSETSNVEKKDDNTDTSSKNVEY